MVSNWYDLCLKYQGHKCLKFDYMACKANTFKYTCKYFTFGELNAIGGVNDKVKVILKLCDILCQY